MTWFRKRRGTPAASTPVEEVQIEEARDAHQAATDLRREVQGYAQRAENVAVNFREIRTRNHLGESIELAMRPRRKRGFRRG